MARMFRPFLCFLVFHFYATAAAATASTKGTLRPTESITDGQVIVSSGNNFTLGFFSPRNSSYRYVGIWYNNIPETTVVWVANRNNPINDSSGVLSFAMDGNLVVSSRRNHVPAVFWSTNVSISSNSTFVKLHDTGNLVLYSGSISSGTGNDNSILWQSFDHPTHMNLANMKLGFNRRTGLNRVMTSWRSKDDPSSGIYSYGFDPHGSPQQFLYKGSTRIWRSGPYNGQRFSGIPSMTQSYLFRYDFINTTDELYIIYYNYNSSIFSPLVLDESGAIQRKTWVEKDHQWTTFFSAPTDKCDYYGHCGAYSSCRIQENTVECSCLPGFQPKSLMDWYLREWSEGCVRKRNLGCGKGDGFLKLEGVKLPDTSGSLVNQSLSVEECKQECFKNCSCTAYAPADITGGGSGCVVWFGNLMDIRYFNSGGDDLYLRVDAVELAAHAKKDKGFLHNKRTVGILSMSLAMGVLLSVAFVYHFLKKRRGDKKLFAWFTTHSSIKQIRMSTRGKIEKQKHSRFFFDFTNSTRNFTGRNELEGIDSNAELPFIELEVVAAATDNFSPNNKLGQGGFGAVYKGRLFSGKEIAVKRLSRNSGQGMEEFKNEVLLIAKLQHRNLVSLLACCVHEEEKILIYEYMPNKSLDSFIFDNSKKALLDWRKRFEIIVGIARGVLYLHQDSRLRIIHRDLKTSNILLDKEMNPKISDFGMARIFGGNQVQANTVKVVGTYGYMSPEYAMQGIFSIKSDVFSFGVLLLEIISGKKNSVYFHKDPSSNLIEHVWNLWKEGRALEIVDSSIGDSFSAHEVSRCIKIGLLCVQESASDRPNMSSVVFMLKNETKIPTPNHPAFIMKRTLTGLDSSGNKTEIGSCSINEMTTTVVYPR